MAKFAIHLNGNLLCAVDVETTGLDCSFHDIWQICVLPLDSYFRPLKEILPFYMNLKPARPSHADPKAINREKLTDVILRGMDAEKAADLFQEWFDKKLGLAIDKMICPVAQNWPFDAGFLHEWLGHTQFNSIFHAWYRDLIPTSLYANDCADLNAEQIPYPKSNLGFLCARLSVEYEVRHDAMADAIATAECYRRMLKRLF